MQLVLRDIAPALKAEVVARAAAHGWPLSRTLLHLLRTGLDRDPIMAGKAGGQARAAALSDDERTAQARAAATARWRK